MKPKDAILGLCMLALMASVIILFIRANSQKNTTLAQLREAQHNLQQTQMQLAQLQTNADEQIVENSRLRSSNQSLAQKVSLLQTETNKLGSLNDLLARQLGALQDTAQQQQEQLQEIQAQDEASAERRVCIANLKEIADAKAAWAVENNKSADAVPKADDLLPYLPDGIFPACPSGGLYSINAVGVPPTCSIPGHVLPQE